MKFDENAKRNSLFCCGTYTKHILFFLEHVFKILKKKMLISLLFFSRIHDFDSTKSTFFSADVDKDNFTLENDPKPNSKFAFVHIFTHDDPQFHRLLQAEILGYQLKNFNNSIDRVLLLPTKIQIPEKHKKILNEVFTHFIYRPFIKWPNSCKGPENEQWEKIYYFKLNIWTLNYSKILYINGYNLFLKDPSPIFEFYPPVAAPDYDTWMIAKYGPTQNTDFLMIEPSIKVFNDIVSFGGCNYTSTPVNASNMWGTAQGPYDNGLIINFFKGDIATLQWWWNYEMPGHYIFKLHHIERFFDQQVVSLRFTLENLPWVDKMSNASLLWTHEADNLYNEYKEVLEHQKYGIVSAVQRMENSPKNNNDQTQIDPNTEASRFYPEFRQITDRQFWIQTFLIIFTSIAFVAYSLTQQPILYDKKSFKF